MMDLLRSGSGGTALVISRDAFHASQPAHITRSPVHQSYEGNRVSRKKRAILQGFEADAACLRVGFQINLRLRHVSNHFTKRTRYMKDMASQLQYFWKYWH
jgi:hypothetical protein